MPAWQKQDNSSALAGKMNGIVTTVPSVPVTQEHPLWTAHKNIREAGIARANAAVTEDRPAGTTEDDYTKKRNHQTVLQQHIDFFDLNHDGVITPLETYTAFRSIGWSVLLALFAVVLIHVGLSYATLDPTRILPDPLFRIYTRNIHRAKHGSDSGTYDNEGRFRPQLFQDFFVKYGEQNEDGQWGMTFKQTMRAVMGQRCNMDLFGAGAALFEWTATYITIWPADGIMMLEDVRGVYDGSYFYKTTARVKGPQINVKHG